MGPRSAWVLNLDADLELAAGRSYAPTRSIASATKAHAVRLATSLLGADDVLVDAETPPGSARGLTGLAFCPTPRALQLLLHAGAAPVAHPPAQVLRAVNSRAFASALGSTLQGAAFATTLEAARAQLQEPPPLGAAWRVKHAFGMAGRNQRILTPGILDGSALAFVRAGLACDGVQIEPNLAIEAELAVHGLLAQDGALRLGALVRQRCDARGVWVASEPLPRDFEALAVEAPGGGTGPVQIGSRLRDEARRVAAALSRAGYFGPFGVDAFIYRDSAGALRLQPRSDINARYTMGFASGFGREGPGGLVCRP